MVNFTLSSSGSLGLLGSSILSASGVLLNPGLKDMGDVTFSCIPREYKVKKVKVSYLMWVVEESPKAYFQPSPWQGFFTSPAPSLGYYCRKQYLIKCYHPELNASGKPSWDRSRIARTEVQPANHCDTELLNILKPNLQFSNIVCSLHF